VIIVGVRFKDAGRIYYFGSGDIDESLLTQGTPIVVETGRGPEYGVITLDRRRVDAESLTQPVRKILRLATAKDTAQYESNRMREAEARPICIEKIKANKLEMHLVDVELTFDLSKIIFYYTADGRVDFRELVKDLASTFRTRIELRQIGARDEAKMLNGIGMCGRTLCCATFLDEFQPVSIKAAKDQSLSLNPTKISGICGKLMCCLKYEEESYEYLALGVPEVGERVLTPDGEGIVQSVNVLRQTAKIAVQQKGQDGIKTETYQAADITRQGHKCGGGKCGSGCGGCNKTDEKDGE